MAIIHIITENIHNDKDIQPHNTTTSSQHARELFLHIVTVYSFNQLESHTTMLLSSPLFYDYKMKNFS